MNPELIKPLGKKEIAWSEWYADKPHLIRRFERVLFFDPAPVYARVGHLIDPFKRHAGLSMEQVFPKLEGQCACGCDKPPKSGEGWQRKWATDECQEFASDVLSIINNYFGKPAKYITRYAGEVCSECTNTHCLELDHIVGVKQGGGGCWLSNYRWLCKDCHTDKTNKDFKRKEYKTTTQLPLFETTTSQK